LAADTTTLNKDTNRVGLIASAFTPGPQFTPSDITEASFGSYAKKVVGAGPCLESRDPATGDVLIVAQPPVGGWRWETTTTANLPQTIYGFWFEDDDGGIWGSEQLNPPVLLTDVNQTIIIDVVGFRILNGSMV